MAPNIHWIGHQLDLSHCGISVEKKNCLSKPRIEPAYSLVTMQDVLTFLIVRLSLRISLRVHPWISICLPNMSLLTADIIWIILAGVTLTKYVNIYNSTSSQKGVFCVTANTGILCGIKLTSRWSLTHANLQFILFLIIQNCEENVSRYSFLKKQTLQPWIAK